MPTVYVDFIAGDSGDGSTGNPYSNIIYALTQETLTTGDLIIKCRGTTNTSWDHGAAITISGYAFTTLVIEPDTGYVWQDTQNDPPLTIWSSATGRRIFDVNQSGVTIRGFRVENRWGGATQREAVYVGSGVSDNSTVIENCKLFSNSSSIGTAIGGGNYATAINCLLANYNDNDTSDAAFSASFSNLRLYYCVIAAGGGQAVGLSSSGSSINSEVVNCLFLHYSDAIEDGVTLGAVSNNATSGTDPGDIGPTPVTGVVAGDFELAAITNPRTGGDDFRVVGGSALLSQATPIAGLTTDAFGNTRDPSTPDIGYHELVTASPPVTGSGVASAQDAAVNGQGDRIIPGFGVASAQASIVDGVGTVVVAVQLLLTAAENRELRNQLGTLLGNKLLNWEWYDTPDVTDGNPIDAGQITTNASGEAIINVLGSSLTNGQEGQLILYDPVDPYTRGSYQIPVTD